MNFQTLILAAGKGTRMRSETPKVLHDILGRPMIGYICEAVASAETRKISTVVGYGVERVERYLAEFSEDLSPPLLFERQANQDGTAHAVNAGLPALDASIEYTLIVPGDCPCIHSRWLKSFVSEVVDSGAEMGLVTTKLSDPSGYGRIVRSEEGRVDRIVEEHDASEEQKRISEINAGIYLVRTDLLEKWIPRICKTNPDNAQDEYYLTDILQMAESVEGFEAPDSDTVIGVNTRRDLAEATSIIQRRINGYWMDCGVGMMNPGSVYIGPEVELESDVELFPNVHLRGETYIESGVSIQNGVFIENSRIGPETLVKSNSYIRDALVGAKSKIGPFAQLRPGANIGNDCKIGNFVEVKKSTVADGAQAGHHAYLGDAEVGEGANIGAGTITCNYDGEQKHKTKIGQNAFTGSNSALVAPLELGDGSYVAAGSVISEDVPPRALGIGRARQQNIEGWND